jgi:hypothetical protein
VESGDDLLERVEMEAKTGRSPRPTEYVRDIVREAEEAKKIRNIVDSRKAKLRPRERVQADLEDEAITEDLKRVPAHEVEAVRASLELATIARDLGVRWSVIAVR